ncbi:Tubulin polyglutamylase ttll6, partial [Gryllus bimaculatus]
SKAKIEAMKRPGFKGKEMLPRPESPRSRSRPAPGPTKTRPGVGGLGRSTQSPLSHGSTSQHKTHVLFSFQPDPILEAEERERLAGLNQRDFLIHSYGIPEKVYFAMLKNGTLRADDEKKYGARLKRDSIQEVNMNTTKDNLIPPSQKAVIISKVIV